MKIFSAAGVVFPGIGPPIDDPPALITRPGLSLVAEFDAFAAFVDQAAMDSKAKAELALGGSAGARINLPRAMYDNFILPVINEAKAPTTATLYDLIIIAYNKIQMSGDKEAIYRYCSFLFIAMFHFSIWFCHEKDREVDPSFPPNHPILSVVIRDYLKKVLDSQHFFNGVRIDPSFYSSDEFKYACVMDIPLSVMLGIGAYNQALGDLTRRNITGYVNLIGGSRARKLDLDAANRVKREFVEVLRSTVRDIVTADVRRFLAELADNPLPSGKILADMFGSFRQYCLGDGTGTRSMFDISNYGLIFFDYQLNNLEDQFNLCKRKILNIPLIDATDDKDTGLSFFHYGLDYDFRSKAIPAPTVALQGFNGTATETIKGATLTADDPWDYRPARVKPLSADNVRLSDSDKRITSLRGDLNSALIPKNQANQVDNWEEMIYIVFKHNIPDPRKPPPQSQIFLAAERYHLDNQFQEILTPATGQAPAKILPADFKAPADLKALAAALAAHPGFVVDARLDGLGIGSPNDPDPPVDKKEHRLVRGSNQNDRPPAGGYKTLRYAHGWMEWTPAPNPWLNCHVAGFVSPLRCTWADKLAADKKALLATYVDNNVTHDSQTRPTYNCVLSGFRAFGLFQAMIEALLDEIDLLQTPAAAAAHKTLKDYLTKEAVVDVTLPTGMPWHGPQLNYDIISKFY